MELVLSFFSGTHVQIRVYMVVLYKISTSSWIHSNKNISKEFKSRKYNESYITIIIIKRIFITVQRIFIAPESMQFFSEKYNCRQTEMVKLM